jgi:alpha-mannosidase
LFRGSVGSEIINMRRELNEIHVKRLQTFIGRLSKDMVYSAHVPLKAVCRVSDEAIPYAGRRGRGGDYKPVQVGDTWGAAWQSAWFHLTGVVPKAWRGADVALRFDANGESLVFDASGCPVYGLTNGSIFASAYSKDIYRLCEPCRGGETVDLWIEAAAYGLFGINRQGDPARDAPERHGNYTGKVVQMELVRFETAVWHYWLDLTTLFDLFESLEANAPRRNQLLETMVRSVDIFEVKGLAGVAAARAALEAVAAVPPNPADLTVTAVGHAHIDVGWLWPVCEGTRKAARTFASQIALFDRYPDYVFGASQPHLYAEVKKHYPALYAKIRAAVAAGRWECQGAMWVEADCNVTGGESLVRQVLHGKNFYKDEFGVDVRNLWLPDVFGYSAALPQILRRAGVDFFLTQKISWNLHNEFPHNTFRWQGIDGSEVLTHFPPENNYNGFMLPKPLRAAQTRFKENGFVDGFASLFGIGDGGGGPREEHVEQGLRLRALNGSPRVAFGTAESYFERLRGLQDRLETWRGELYLECHRGTFTTQAKTKRGNRKLELKLRETEMFLSMLPPKAYPRPALDALWKMLLTNQFHDILPGSSINRVYREVERQHAEALAACDGLMDRAARTLLRADARAVTLFNSLGVVYTAPVRLDASWKGCRVLAADGAEVAVQDNADSVTVAVPLPPYSFTTLRRGGPRTAAPARCEPKARVLENDLIRYEFDDAAVVTRIYDKARRAELLPPGAQGNRLALYADRPHNYDAWEVDVWYQRQRIEGARPVACRGRRPGVVCDELDFELAIGEQSTIRQRVRLPRHSRRLDFETQVDWRELHRMLRVSFDTGIDAAEGTCDIQYGYLRRPTHRNTSWDMAKFEVAAHRYVDLSDNQSGLALLNDCKYGYKLDGRQIDLNLLRSPTHPDPDADIGLQTFTYALLPHEGRLIDSGVIAEAAMLNQPPAAFYGRAARVGTALPCTLVSDGISLEVLKQAEREDCLVVRLVETRGCRSCGVLHLPEGARLVETGLMEWDDGAVISGSTAVEVTLSPFEIRTYKIR